MRWLALILALLAQMAPGPALADMFPDAGNAKLPEAQINLGVAAAGNPAKFDPLCDGRTTDAEVNAGTAYDCTAAINSAAAVVVNGLTANVQLQPGIYYVKDTINLLSGQTLIGAGRSRTIIRVRDTFNPAAQAVIKVAAAPAFNGLWPGVRDLTINFSQAINQSVRANFQLLGSCTSSNTGTGCKYPPAILLMGGRTYLDRLRIDKAWDGIASNSVATVNSPGGDGNSTINIHDMQISASNTGLWIDGPLDTSYIERFHFWSFGTAGLPLEDLQKDGLTDCLRIGNMDGLVGVNMFCHMANMHFINSVVNPGDGVAGTLTNVTLDHGSRFIYELGNILEVTNLVQSGGHAGEGMAVPPNCQLTVNTVANPASRLMISHYWVQNALETPVCVYSGVLQIDNVRVISFDDRPSVILNGGVLYMRNAVWPSSGAAVRLAPIIWQQSGTMVLSGHTDVGPTAGGGGLGLRVDVDSGNHNLTDLNFNGYGVSFGCGATAGYCFSGKPLGFFDLPAHSFAMSATPSIAGSSDFAVLNHATSGQWWLRGNKVEFWLREEFDSNAYTTGTGFKILTTMPAGIDTLPRTCSLSRFDKVAGYTALEPRCVALNNAGGTATDFQFWFPVPGGTKTDLTRAANILPSVADYLFFLQGWYPIR